MRRILPALLFVLSAASAQTTEFGGAVGSGGHTTSESANVDRLVVFGAEGCFACSGRFAFFADYSHWESVNPRPGYIRRMDLVSGGLRIQGRRRVRPFFDIGVTGGSEQYDHSYYGPTRYGLVGLLLGGGVSVSVGERWYIRPQFRVHAMGVPRAYDVVAAASLSVAVGYRW